MTAGRRSSSRTPTDVCSAYHVLYNTCLHCSVFADDAYEHRDEPQRRGRPRPRMLSDEVACLEQTLERRRAELREADRVLRECRADLVGARKEVQLQQRQLWLQTHVGFQGNMPSY